MEDKDEQKFKCSTFNGDTADGRTLWPDWLRDVELVLDEWSWAVMNDTVITHDLYEKLSSKKKLKEDEEISDRSSIDVVVSDEGVRGKTRSYKLSTCKLRELVLMGDVVMVYIKTCRQVGDLFTKNLGPQLFCEFTDKATGYWTRWENGLPPKRYRYSSEEKPSNATSAPEEEK